MACFIVRDLEETEVAKEFATSFAPVISQYQTKSNPEFLSRTDIPSIKEGKYHANGKDVVELVERHLGGRCYQT